MSDFYEGFGRKVEVGDYLIRFEEGGSGHCLRVKKTDGWIIEYNWVESVMKIDSIVYSRYLRDFKEFVLIGQNLNEEIISAARVEYAFKS